MPTQVIEYKCLLMSPSNVSEERDALTELVTLWNAQIGRGLNTRVELVRWESHSVPDMSMAPQEVINNQLVKDCDFGIALFWARVGTKTAKHPSGSVEEIFGLINRGARVLVYFCNRDVPQSALKDDQYAELQELKKTFYKQGLLAQHTTPSDLQQQVQLHLTNVVTQLLAQDRGATTFLPVSGSLTAPTPDVRLEVRHAIVSKPNGTFQAALSIKVQNYSPIVVYLKMVQLQLKSGGSLVLVQDAITGEWQRDRELHPGQSFTFYYTFEHLKQHFTELVCATATDAISRVYRSDEQEFASAIKRLMDDIDEGNVFLP